MNERERTALLKLFGGDEAKAEKFLEEAGAVDRSIQEQGLITRQKQEEPAAEEDEEEGAARLDLSIELDEEAAGEIAAQILESETVRALIANQEALRTELDALKRELSAERQQANEKWGIAEERLSSLEATDEEKQRQWQADMPRRATQRVTYRPRDAHRGEQPQEGERSMQDIAEQTLAELTSSK